MDELYEKAKQFSETLRKETVENFKFAKEQLDQFADDKIKEIIKIEEAAVTKFEAQSLAYKKDSDDKGDMARKELINLMERRTATHRNEIKEECSSNLKKMEEMAAKLEQRLQTVEQTVSIKLHVHTELLETFSITCLLATGSFKLQFDVEWFSTDFRHLARH